MQKSKSKSTCFGPAALSNMSKEKLRILVNSFFTSQVGLDVS